MSVCLCVCPSICSISLYVCARIMCSIVMYMFCVCLSVCVDCRIHDVHLHACILYICMYVCVCSPVYNVNNEPLTI